MGLIAGGSLLFSACASSPQQKICEEELPLFDRRLDTVMVSLRVPGEASTPARSPAWADVREDTQTQAKGVVLDLERILSGRERQEWVQWSERQLFGIQSTIGLARAHPQPDRRRTAIVDLNRVANYLVMFHGQAERGDKEAMRSLATRMQQHQRAAYEALCSVDR
jgi:hypothetical protein